MYSRIPRSLRGLLTLGHARINASAKMSMVIVAGGIIHGDISSIRGRGRAVDENNWLRYIRKLRRINDDSQSSRITPHTSRGCVAAHIFRVPTFAKFSPGYISGILYILESCTEHKITTLVGEGSLRIANFSERKNYVSRVSQSSVIADMLDPKFWNNSSRKIFRGTGQKKIFAGISWPVTNQKLGKRKWQIKVKLQPS